MKNEGFSVKLDPSGGIGWRTIYPDRRKIYLLSPTPLSQCNIFSEQSHLQSRPVSRITNNSPLSWLGLVGFRCSISFSSNCYTEGESRLTGERRISLPCSTFKLNSSIPLKLRGLGLLQIIDWG